MKSSTDFFSNSLAKRPGQYGSTSTPAALTMEAMLSACAVKVVTHNPKAALNTGRVYDEGHESMHDAVAAVDVR